MLDATSKVARMYEIGEANSLDSRLILSIVAVDIINGVDEVVSIINAESASTLCPRPDGNFSLMSDIKRSSAQHAMRRCQEFRRHHIY